MTLVTSAEVSGPAMDWLVETTEQNPTTARANLVLSINIGTLFVIIIIITIGSQTDFFALNRSAPGLSAKTIPPSACFPLRLKSYAPPPHRRSHPSGSPLCRCSEFARPLLSELLPTDRISTPRCHRPFRPHDSG